MGITLNGSLAFDKMTYDRNGYWRIQGKDFRNLYNNIYCVEHNKTMDGMGGYRLATKINIRGNNAEFTQYNTENKNKEVIRTGTSTNEANNILAAILGKESDSNWSWGFWKSKNVYSSSQKALYKYWNEWINKSGASSYGVKTYDKNENGLDANELNNLLTKAKGFANERLYNVNVYYFVFKEALYYSGSNKYNWQALILVERLGSSLNKHQEITVTKTWDDSDNIWGNRPDSIQVTLYGNDKKVTKDVNGDTITNPIKLSGDSWSGTFKNLAQDVTYTVEESGVPDGYTTEDPSGSASKGFTITNTLKTTSVSVTKKWSDGSNRDGKRTASVKVTLYNGDTKITKDAKGNNITNPVTLNEDNKWKHTFSNLPEYINGKKATYKVQEDTVPTGYTANVTGDATNGFTITNTHNPEKVKVPVTKVWDDGDNRDGIRPSSVEVTLYKNGTATTTKVTLNESNNWKYTFENLYKYESGTAITYTVQEKVPTGYTQETTGDATNGFTITNTHTPETVKVPVTKAWDDDNNRDGKRPSSVEVILYKNGTATTTKATLNESNNWKYTFSNLYKYESGTAITYTVEETVPTGYTKQITGDATNGFTITNTHVPDGVKISVNKVWNDDNNRDGMRPSSVEVTLYKNGTATTNKATLSASNSWKYTFENLYKYESGTAITYTVQETVPTGYTQKTTGNATNGFTITNTHVPERVKVPVTKVWDDDGNRDGKRPTSVEVTLYKNGTATTTKATLNASNNWKYTFENLYKYESGTAITYTVQETVPTGYTQKTTGNATNGFTITNTHVPERVKVPVTKVWDDENDRDKIRPSSVEVTLYKNGKVTTTKATLNASNNWKYTFSNLYKYESGNVITYTVKEKALPGGWEGYTEKTTGDATNGYIITNTHIPEEVDIMGKVWHDKSNGNIDDDESGLGGIKVRLKDAKGTAIRATYSNENGEMKRTDYAITKSDGSYTIRVYNDDGKTPKEALDKAYIEFEYDAMKYTTVVAASTGAKTSKAIENETTRNKFDKNHSTITTSTKHPDILSDNVITATTKNVITSFNAYRGINENTEKIENVLKIKNINLGLFEREQPKVGIFSDIRDVILKMNEQKMNEQNYTYLYGVRSKDFADADIKTQFQNKDEYKYERPVNLADISYIYKTNNNTMSVSVTYEIQLANLSTTLPITVQNIINVYDLGYNSPKITYNGKNVEYTTSSIYGSKEERGFNEITLNNLNIAMMPGQISSKIEITYEVSKEEIRGIFNGNASLHNAVEIHTYSTTYGESTMYAEQRTGGRTGTAYAGYDYETHPGNAAIEKQGEILKSTKNLVEYETGKFGPERDTDISPSFILCKGKPKILAGTVFEDTDADTTDKERLGDGKYDSVKEKGIQNVKVELFKVNDDGSSILADLYKDNGETIEAVTYSDIQGNYSFGSNEEKYGVVTGEYFIKFTYGNNTKAKEDGTQELKFATTMDGGRTGLNARNYKSTIIKNDLIKQIFNSNYEEKDRFDKNWHIKIEDNYSIAVDNMKDRLEIEDLQNSNFNRGENMTAYSKPFMTQVEFETSGKAQTSENGYVTSNILSKLDFGIIERPREDIFIQQRVTYLKITLSNGQVLIEGDPTTQNLNYVKTMGQGQIFENSSQAGDFDRRLLVEMDAELIQGAQLEAKYEVAVKNNNEIDYDYGTKEDFNDIADVDDTTKCDQYISKSSKANYYYYGKSDNLQEIKSTIEIVDYLNNDVVYDEPEEGMPIVWVEKTSSEMNREGLISDDTSKALEDGQHYRIFAPASNEGKITLAVGETSETFTMLVSKHLANKDENIYDNHVEIVRIDGKSGRTISALNEGKQEKKSYIPGDYVPTLDNKPFETQNKQQDDDKVSVILTNATGVTNYIITYLIIGLIGLMVIAIGVVIIRKVLMKK